MKSDSSREGAVFAYPVACRNSGVKEKQYAGDYFVTFKAYFCRYDTFFTWGIINRTCISGCELYTVLKIEDYTVNCVGISTVFNTVKHHVTHGNFALKYLTACFRFDYS